MCELLGLSFNKPVDIQISFKGFRERGRSNPHGWGLGSYDPDGKAIVIKEAAESASSRQSEAIAEDPLKRSNIFIGHVRFASRGERSIGNTHPFQLTLNGRDYVFAHNGTLTGYRSYLPLRSFLPAGETDSEWAFCYLADQIRTNKLDFTNKDSFLRLQEILRLINRCGNFNCLFSDGERLFAYFDQQGYNGLYFTYREPPFQCARLIDIDWELDLGYLKDPSENGYIIATQPLTDESWERMGNGELIVFEQGQMIWSNMREVSAQN